jgi:hypothetical protein
MGLQYGKKMKAGCKQLQDLTNTLRMAKEFTQNTNSPIQFEGGCRSKNEEF